MVEVKEVEIEENEQWNIINQTGILKNEKIMKPTPPPDYLFEASLLTIPLSMLQAGLDLTLHQQYGSIFCGIQVINFTVRDRSFFGMKKAPGYAVLWIYFIIQSDLLVAAFSLIFPLVYFYWDTFKTASAGHNKLEL